MCSVQHKKPKVDRNLDEIVEEETLEQELFKLQRQYQILSSKYLSYKEQSQNELSRQNFYIHLLESERQDIDAFLGNVGSSQLSRKDNCYFHALTNKLDEMKLCYREIVEEREKLHKDTQELNDVEEKLANNSRKNGGYKSFFEGIWVTKLHLMRKRRVLQNRCNKVLESFNSTLGANMELRLKINNIRIEHRIFNKLFRKVSVELDECKRNKKMLLQEASQALDIRQEALSKTLALKERNDKEQILFDATMKDLQRAMRNDSKICDFMVTKGNDRAEFKAEEQAKRERDIKAALEHDLQTLNNYREAFARIQEVTDETDIDLMLNNFVTKECENFALFNYINELNREIDSLQEVLLVVHEEVDGLQGKEEEKVHQNADRLTLLEQRYEEIHEQATQSETELKEVNKILDELQAVIANTFKRTGCDPRSIEKVHGLDTEMSVKTIVIYLGEIEERTNQLINVLQYVKLKENVAEGIAPSRIDPAFFQPKTLPDPQIDYPTTSAVAEDDVTADMIPFNIDDMHGRAVMAVSNRVRPNTENKSAASDRERSTARSGDSRRK